MVGLNTTWDWVVMLLVALGVGMIGGIGAALIEGRSKIAAKPPESEHWFLDTTSCIVLGGLAAVAVMYFFAPTKEVIPKSGKSEVFYELIKLVPLSIIIGSAGTYFLQGFQKRVDGALATQASAQVAGEAKTVADFALALPDQADKSLDNAAGSFQAALTGASIPADKAEEVVPRLIEVAKDATSQGIEPHVDAIQTLAEGIGSPSRSPGVGRGS